MKIQLKGRAIPRSTSGDPKFEALGLPYGFSYVPPANTLLGAFTQEEVVELVNRALYQLEYQHNAHKQRGQRERDRERAIKQKVKELFHVSWLKATPEQVAKAKEALGE